MAGRTGIRLPAGRGGGMNSILGEWREGKVRPLPGNAPHGRLVSRGLFSSRSICDDPFRATRFPQRVIPGPSVCVFKACRDPSVRCGRAQNQTWVGTNRLPLVGPRYPGKRTCREDHALLIVRDEFRPAIPRSGCSPALPISASPTRAS